MFVSGDDPSIEVSSSQPSHVIYEKEEKIKIDYSGLTDNLQDLDDGDDVRKVEKNLEKQINEVANTIQRIQVRNMINSKTYYKKIKSILRPNLKNLSRGSNRVDSF